MQFSPHDRVLHHDHRHAPLLPALHHQGGAGVRESSHLQAGKTLVRRSAGPGVFFIIPCVDVYEKIDLRTATYEIPPQEVKCLSEIKRHFILFIPSRS